jgi:DNA invertase Pin-like site-specific DNA recombinase
MPDTLGYARVSTDDQDLAGQVLRLKAAGAARTYEDVISGRTFDRPGLKALLDYACVGDTLAVVRLDRLGRSLRELLEVVETLKARQIALVSLEEKSTRPRPPVNWSFTSSARSHSSNGG